jgi:Protein of unknown function (DUF4012)
MTGRHGVPASHRTRRRWPRRVLVVLSVALVAVVGWLAYSGLQARSELDDAKAATEQLRAALVSGDTQAAEVDLGDVMSHADQARSLTSDLVWRAAGWLPYVGRTPAAVTQASADVAGLAHDVLPALVQVGRGLSPATLRAGAAIDVTALAATAPVVAAAASGLQSAQQDLTSIQLGGVAGPVADGVRSVADQVAGLSSELASAATATKLLPGMLGAYAPRRYLIVFQNNAEARATGGLVGAFGVVQATKGTLSVVRLGSDAELRSASAPVVDLGPAYRSLFGADPALWPNTNLSADFPSAAVQQLELWRRQFGERLDGVIATDPVALGYLLSAAGPATLPGGEKVTGSKVADLTMREVYQRYAKPSQVPERKAFLQLVAKSALDQILAGAGSGQAELKALARAAGERRLLVYSAHPAEERLLAVTELGGAVDASPGPYAGLAVDNASGSKIDYYLDRRLAYALGTCSPSATTRSSTISVSLHDGAPPTGLPAYAAYRLDRGLVTSPAGRGGDGSVRETVLVYAATGAQLTSATLDGVAATVTPGRDGTQPGRPVFVLSVVLDAGQTRTVVLNLTEPVTPFPPRAWVAPLVRSSTSTVQAGTCR